MSKKLQLSIPEPCHENWDVMTPVEKGKFCGSCEKQVVDFSNMSDRQVAEFFKKPSTGSICGRFMTEQLDRDIEIPRKRIPWLKYFFQFVIPAFLVSIKVTAQKTQGTIAIVKTTKDTTTIPKHPLLTGKVACTKPVIGYTMTAPVEEITKTDTVALPEVVVSAIGIKRHQQITLGAITRIDASQLVHKTVINGKVIDEKGDPISQATVLIKGTGTGVMSGTDGSFSLTPEAGWNNITLVGSYIGFNITGVLVDKKNLPASVIIQLKSVESMMVGGLIVCRKPVTKKELRKIPLIPVVTDDKHIAAFKVFPNPIESGNNLNIEIKKIEEGYYSLQLLNQAGQSIHQQKIWIDAEASVLNIDIPEVAAGSYFLTLTDKKSGKKFSEKIIIQ